jgi:dephospho-CoA kinase
MKFLVGFVGMPGSGKSTALQIAKRYGPIVVMGDIIREELQDRGLPKDSFTLGQIAQELREKYGKVIVAERCSQKILAMDEKRIVIDGIRSMAEVQEFKKYFKLVIIAIIAPTELRHQWLKTRGRCDDSNNMTAIKRRDNRELTFGIADVIHNAQYKIYNNKNISDLQNKCHQILQEIFSQYD